MCAPAPIDFSIDVKAVRERFAKVHTGAFRGSFIRQF